MDFRGASAEAVAALRDDLRERVESGADGSRVGSDLFSLADLLRSEPGLRRAATDVSTPPDARSGLVDTLVSGKIDEHALALVTEAVRRRWTSSRDLANALALLGVVAVARSTEARGRLEDELFAVGRTLKEHPELRVALSDPARGLEAKQDLVRGLLEDKALPATVLLAERALADTYSTVSVALKAYEQVAADVFGEHVATVLVADELPESARQRLAEALTRQYGRDVHLNVLVDRAVLGGARVEIGDEVIDGTVASRLDEVRRKIAG